MEEKKPKRITNANWMSTSLIGYVNMPFDQLKRLFGDFEVESDPFKIDYEVEFILDGYHFTIYNWKDGNNYLGEEGMPIEDITEWHIGGTHERNLSILQSYLDDFAPGVKITTDGDYREALKKRLRSAI